MNRNEVNENNILFVGNGIDLLAGYKTDYPSFLNNYKNHFTKILLLYIESKLLTCQLEISNGKILEIDTKAWATDILFDEGKVESLRENYEIDKYNLFLVDNDKSNSRSVYSRTKFLKNIGILDFANSDFIEKGNFDNLTPNSWITYFIRQYIYNKKVGKDWVDLEELIKESSVVNSSLSHNYEQHFSDLYTMIKGNINNRKKADFLEMKQLLVEYLKVEKKEVKDEIKVHTELFWHYENILNFNYSSNYCLDPQNRYKTSEFELCTSKLEEIYIHGEVGHNEKIVFGFDDGVTKDSATKRYGVRREDKKYSKTSQLLALATYNFENLNGGLELPQPEEIRKIGILGHGIGEADYNYFETLCDFDKVIIEVYWYKFRDEKTGEITERDNKDSLMESLVNMMHEMELRKDKVILHKMLIENRIVFKEFVYIVNDL